MNRDVWLRVEGSLLERLLQRALKQGAHFARVRRTGRRTIVVASDARSAEVLTALCRRYGLDCRVLRRGGWTALKDVLRARWTLAPGLLLCVVCCVLALSRIWLVDVRFTGPCAALGNRSEILACLDAAGVRPGMSAARLETELLQKQLMAGAENYSFIGVRRQGIRLLVEASPEVPAPEIYALDRARDLVAARDGIIESITVHAGEACVARGDTVRAGQILIRGEEARSQEETAPVRALGEVMARCWVEGSAEGKLTHVESRRTGRSAVNCSLRLMGLRLALSGAPPFSSQEAQAEILPVVGLFLPLEIERTTCFETAEVRTDMDARQLEAQLEALARSDALRKLPDGAQYKIANSWTDVQQDENRLRLRAVYEIYADIAVTRDALIEEVY